VISLANPFGFWRGEGGGERNIGRWAAALLVVFLGWRLRSGWVRASPEAEGVGGERDAFMDLRREIVLGGDALMGRERAEWEREGLYLFFKKKIIIKKS
jgi:hypothetical protein